MKLKTNILLFLLPLVGLNLAAQKPVQLSGQVVEKNSKLRTGQVKYLSEVMVSVGEKSSPTDGNGNFKLDFPDQPHGNQVWVQAKKSGYELVNAADLMTTSLKSGANPLRVVMARTEQIAQEEVILKKAIEEAYLASSRQKIARLEKPGPDRDALLKEMSKDFNREFQNPTLARSLLLVQQDLSKRKAVNLTDKLLVENQDDQPRVCQRAYLALVEKKDIELAKSMLDSALAGQAADLPAEKLPIFIFKARLHNLNDEFERATLSYGQAYALDKLNINLAKEVAAYCEEQGQRDLAIKAYQRILSNYREAAEANAELYEPGLATVLDQLGSLYFQAGKYQEAEQNLGEALKIRTKLAEKNPNTFSIQAASTAIVAGIMQYEQLEATKAGEHYEVGSSLLLYARNFLDFYPEISPEILVLRRAIDGYLPKFKKYEPDWVKPKANLLELEASVKLETDPVKKANLQKELIKEQERLAKDVTKTPELIAAIGNEYGSLSWYQLFARDFVGAENSARTGMELAPNSIWIATNLAHALLFQGKWEEAKAIYLGYKDKTFNGEKLGKGFLSDFAELEAAGITHADVGKVREMME